MGDVEVMLKHYRVRRAWRAVMYFGLILSGVFAFIEPPELVIAQVSAGMAATWGAAMILSSAVCLFGSLTDRWIGEYTGLPLLSSVLGLYGFSVIMATEGQSLVLLAYGFLVLSFAAGLIARWGDIQAIKKYAMLDRNSHQPPER